MESELDSLFARAAELLSKIEELTGWTNEEAQETLIANNKKEKLS